ncbi:MAG: hypothetical protein K6B64_00765 [Acholeplasmatales bacterium]|nr:hypothetical protein [Acholeplasmatales bacterium]
MGLIDIIVLVVIILVVSLIIGRYIYKRIKNIPTGSCGDCSLTKDANRTLKKIRKELDEEMK